MQKDKRYIMVKRLMHGGFIHSFREIFEIIPKSTVARDLGTHNMRFTKLMYHVELFSLIEMIRMASLFEIEYDEMVKVILAQLKEDRRQNKSLA